MKVIEEQEFALLVNYIKALCGHTLESSKKDLLDQRLSPIADELNCSSWSEFYLKVISDNTGILSKKVIEAITTHETSFFRDLSLFELLQQKIFPELVSTLKIKPAGNTPKPLRIWSAACSSGQEAYSVGIAIREFLGNTKEFDVRIMGTDISHKVIEKADFAGYSKFEVGRGVSSEKLEKYFIMKDNHWLVRDELRAMTTFKSINLLEPVLFSHKFDIVLCRNVAIYFSEEDKKKLFLNIASVMAPDGYLLIGATESITSICPQFKVHEFNGAFYYQRNNRA